MEKLTENWQRLIFQSLISPRLIVTAQIGVLLLKALYLSFQMHTTLVGLGVGASPGLSNAGGTHN